MRTGRRPCKDEGREKGDASTNQGTPDCQQSPGAWNSFSLMFLKGTNIANTLISDFWSPGPRDSTLVLSRSCRGCCFVVAVLANYCKYKGRWAELQKMVEPWGTGWCNKLSKTQQGCVAAKKGQGRVEAALTGVAPGWKVCSPGLA